MRSLRLVCGILALSAAFSLPSHASPITYTESVIGSGSLNGVSFTNQLVTFSGSADTAAIADDLGFYFVFLTNPTVQIGAGPAVGLTGDIDASDNTSNPSAEFGEYFPGDWLILSTDTGVFATYHLDSTISQSGPANFNPTVYFPTTSGNFILDEAWESPTTFACSS